MNKVYAPLKCSTHVFFLLLNKQEWEVLTNMSSIPFEGNTFFSILKCLKLTSDVYVFQYFIQSIFFVCFFFVGRGVGSVVVKGNVFYVQGAVTKGVWDQFPLKTMILYLFWQFQMQRDLSRISYKRKLLHANTTFVMTTGMCANK